MLNALVRSALRLRVLVLAGAALLLVYGLATARRAQLGVFPEFAPPTVTVQTQAPGLSPEEVEQLVTLPLERALNGLPGLAFLRSQSIQGAVAIDLTFADGTDLLQARQQVGERVAEAAGHLPQGVGTPTLAPLSSSTAYAYAFGLTSATRSPMDLRSYLDWTLKPKLLGIPGMANVSSYGGEVRQLQVQLLPGRLQARGLSLEQVRQAVAEATGIRGAGFLDTPEQRLVLRSEGQALTPERLAQVAVAAKDGAVLRLGDIARVAWGPAPPTSAAMVDGRAGVTCELFVQPGADVMAVTRSIEALLKAQGPDLARQGIALHAPTFRVASFIETAVGNARNALLLGGLLVVAVLVAFLRDPRTAFISLTAIPLSLLAAVIVLVHLGFTLNTLTLGGLTIALGEVVDDAIIDVENILRRLRLARAAGDATPAMRIVLDASLEVRGSVVFATGVVALVMFPVLTLSGVQGRIFAPLGWAYLAAVLASLLVALTVTPAMTLLLFGQGRLPHVEPAWVSRLKARYHRYLEDVMARPRALLLGAGLVTAAAVVALPFLPGGFLPDFREGHLILQMNLPTGASLQESLRTGRRVAAVLSQLPAVARISQRAGRTEGGDDTVGPQFSEFDLELKPGAPREAPDEIRQALQAIPGADFEVKTYLADRVDDYLSGSAAPVVVQLNGSDLDQLDQAAARVKAVLAAVPGAQEVAVDSPPGQPEWTLRVDPEAAARFGLRPVQVLEAVETAFQGEVLGQIFDGPVVTDVALTVAPAAKADPARIGALTLQTPDGRSLPLSQVAHLVPGTGRYAVLHDGGQRRAVVTCSVQGRGLAAFVKEAQAAVRAKAGLPPGITARFGGELEATAAARRELALHLLIALAGILALLSLVFHSRQNLLLVLANLPFALMGGILAACFTGGTLNLGALVGFVTLFGITTRNSIMLVSHAEHLVLAEGFAWNAATARRAAEERLVPILMTATATGLAILPLALGASAPGREIEGPMAIVILGGLLSSTALNLLLLPVLLPRFGRFPAPAPTTAPAALPQES
ncbi:MAG TPA: efflux RND transporter permease subunit [Holophagaceae bacterium]|nr:efflux RND transporter permease subunit [Holophagaceae bacterium]